MKKTEKPTPQEVFAQAGDVNPYTVDAATQQLENALQKSRNMQYSGSSVMGFVDRAESRLDCIFWQFIEAVRQEVHLSRIAAGLESHSTPAQERHTKEHYVSLFWQAKETAQRVEEIHQVFQQYLAASLQRLESQALRNLALHEDRKLRMSTRQTLADKTLGSNGHHEW